MHKRRFLDIDILGPTCQLSYDKNARENSTEKILTVFDYVNALCPKEFYK